MLGPPTGPSPSPLPFLPEPRLRGRVPHVYKES